MPAIIENLERALRHQVCPHCTLRAIDSDLLPADEPRSCEAQCAVFRNLPQLEAIVERLDPLAGSFEHAIQSLLCLECRAMPLAAHCNARVNKRCALARYPKQVAAVLERERVTR